MAQEANLEVGTSRREKWRIRTRTRVNNDGILRWIETRDFQMRMIEHMADLVAYCTQTKSQKGPCGGLFAFFCAVPF